MKTIGIFYGSSNGTTEGVAKQIAEKLGVKSSDIHDVSQASPADFAPYEVLLLGSSTWGAGDLQDDWYDFLPKIKNWIYPASWSDCSAVAILLLSAILSATRSGQSTTT